MLRVYTTTYNIINITTIVIGSIIQYYLLVAAPTWYYLSDDLAVILLLPILIIIGIISANRAFLKRKIHKENFKYYEANNISIDNAVDNGSLTEEHIALLPRLANKELRPRRKREHINFDMFAYGELNDIGIKYSVDNFRINYSIRVFDDWNTVYNFHGDALIVEFINMKQQFENPIVYSGQYLKSKVEFPLPKREKYKNAYFYYDEKDDDDLNIIKKIISDYSNLFSYMDKQIVIFKDNNMIFLTSKKHKFKIKIPLLITKGIFENKINNQKGQIYRFIMFLTDISRMMNMRPEKRQKIIDDFIAQKEESNLQ